jgi:hypothetical protein
LARYRDRSYSIFSDFKNFSAYALASPAFAVELFRYRGAAKDGGTLEYVFEAGEQNSPNAVTKEKAAEIAADFMTTFYHVRVGALETQEFEHRRYRSGSFASLTR